MTMQAFISAIGTAENARTGYDTLIGLTSGEIKLLSLQGQLAAPPTTTRLARPPMVFNGDGCVNSTRCICVEFLPKNECASFISVHANGDVFLHLLPSEPRTSIAGEASQQSPHPMKLVECGVRITSAAVSPDGSSIAMTTKDGILVVYDLERGEQLCGFKSYYGGFLCVAWSSDGKFLAAGGEDDLVMYVDFLERSIIAHCQGHSSFVSGVVFDPKRPLNGDHDDDEEDHDVESSSMRSLCSVGLDGNVCLWEIEPLTERSTTCDMNDRYRRESGRIPNGVAGEFRGISGNQTSLSPRPSFHPSVPRAEMNFVSPIGIIKAHYEPLSGVKMSEDSMYVVSLDGSIKRYLRDSSRAPSPGLT